VKSEERVEAKIEVVKKEMRSFAKWMDYFKRSNKTALGWEEFGELERLFHTVLGGKEGGGK